MTFKQCNGRTPTNVSIDQVNHKEGYVIGNIQLVCMAVNQMNQIWKWMIYILFVKQYWKIKNSKKWSHKKS